MLKYRKWMMNLLFINFSFQLEYCYEQLQEINRWEGGYVPGPLVGGEGERGRGVGGGTSVRS